MIPIIVKPNILTNNKIKKLNKEQRRNAIRGYAESQAKLVKNKKKCSCHAMVDIWDYAKQFYTHWFNNDEESYVEDVGEMLQSLWMHSDGESILIAYQTATDISQLHFLISDDDPQEYEHYVVDSEGNRLKNAHILGDEIYVLSEFSNSDNIYCYQIGNPMPELIQSFDPGFHLSDFTVGESGALAFVHEIWYSSNLMNLDFRYNNESGLMAGIVNWSYPFDDISY